ncbi:MAG: ribonuclease HIII [Planctomycetes bacterium]|nr:ribonuclease HIII [Planctomycetota bacterium]
MAGLNMFVDRIDDATGEALEAMLRDAAYEFREVAHAHFGAKGESVSVVWYSSGKLVVQGKGASEFRLHRLQELTGLPTARLEVATIGCDEAGKGDYFGPLVAAAVAMTPAEEQFLDEVPLVDSKVLGDRQIGVAAEHLRNVLPHEVVVIGPRRYNELYAKFQNVNHLLAWAHAKAMLAVKDKSGVNHVLLDKFCDESVVKRALGARASEIDLLARPRAEDDPAVAAASLLARDAFVRGIDRLRHVAGRPLPKGAGSPVLKAGRALVKERGRSILTEVAKVHFRTTGQIGG